MVQRSLAADSPTRRRCTTCSYAALIIFFSYFYVSIIFNPMDQADNMKKYGGFIPGIRPGKKTAEYIDGILTRLTFGGAIYLAAISVLPVLLISGLQVQQLPGIGPTLDALLPKFLTEGLNVKFFFGGHLAPHRRRCGHGHRATNRVAADHAALRGVHEGHANSGTPELGIWGRCDYVC